MLLRVPNELRWMQQIFFKTWTRGVQTLCVIVLIVGLITVDYHVSAGESVTTTKLDVLQALFAPLNRKLRENKELIPITVSFVLCMQYLFFCSMCYQLIWISSQTKQAHTWVGILGCWLLGMICRLTVLTLSSSTAIVDYAYQVAYPLEKFLTDDTFSTHTYFACLFYTVLVNDTQLERDYVKRAVLVCNIALVIILLSVLQTANIQSILTGILLSLLIPWMCDWVISCWDVLRKKWRKRQTDAFMQRVSATAAESDSSKRPVQAAVFTITEHPNQQEFHTRPTRANISAVIAAVNASRTRPQKGVRVLTPAEMKELDDELSAEGDEYERKDEDAQQKVVAVDINEHEVSETSLKRAQLFMSEKDRSAVAPLIQAGNVVDESEANTSGSENEETT